MIIPFLLFVLISSSVVAQTETSLNDLSMPLESGLLSTARPDTAMLKKFLGDNASLLPANPLDKLSFNVIPYGIIKTDYYWDSRQVLGNREDQELLWPLARNCDPCGRDINAHPQFQFTPVQSRVGFLITGPAIGSKKQVKARAAIEADYFGNNELLINQFRLRHAFLRLDFERYRAHLLFGQYWHPLFQPDCFIRDLSFTYGTPFDTVARQPQIRYTQEWDRATFVIAALSQRDFKSLGVLGLSTSYLRESRIPNFCADFRWYLPDENFIGFSIDGKVLAPRIVSNSGYSVKEHVGSVIAQGYASITLGNLTFNSKAIYAQNAADFVMISGYGISSIACITDKQTYAPTACYSIWSDMFYLSDFGQHRFQLEYGLMVGGTKNLGATRSLVVDPVTCTPTVYALDPTISYVWRVAPRFLFKRYPVRFGAEVNATGAAFGHMTDRAKIINATSVTDIRFLFIAYYVF